MLNTISFERLLEVTADDLNAIRDNLGAVYMNETIDSETKNVALATAFNTIDSWSSYYNMFKEIQDSKIDELNRANDSLVGENKKLASENSKLKEDLVMLNEKINNAHYKIGALQATLESMNNNSNLVSVDLVEMIESLEKAVNLIDENAKALTLSKKLKTEPNVNKHGEDHPRYNKYIDNDSLIADYKSGMILKDLSKKYKISIPGVRNRLMDLGVYKQVYKKN